MSCISRSAGCATSIEPKPVMIFQLGTNNWQTLEEPAPGSGILHEAHHLAYNNMAGSHSYSVYPSAVHDANSGREKVKVVKLPHKIPICESVSPVSDKRWHGMSDAEIEVCLKMLEKAAYEQMALGESEQGRQYDFVIAHHCLWNPLVMQRVIAKRVAEGKPKTPIVVFCHGTALKMFDLEAGDSPEYPSRFKPLLDGLKVFDDVAAVVTISEENKKAFLRHFPSFDEQKVFVSLNGYNPLVFYPRDEVLQEGLKTFSALPGGGNSVETEAGSDLCTVQAPPPRFPPLPSLLHPSSRTAERFKDLKGKVPEFVRAGFKEPKGKVPDVYEGPDKVRGALLGDGSNHIPADRFSRMVLFVGKFADWKRLDAVLKAASKYEVKYPEVCTVIAGTGQPKDVKYYQDMAYKELHLQNVFFVGPQMQPDLARLCSMADVGVFPSKAEPFGMVFIECMACGTPVIGANSGGPRDFVSGAVGTLIPDQALSVPADDTLVNDLFNAISTALDEDWKAVKGQACIKATESFSMNEQCRGIAMQLQRILKL